MVFNAMTAVFLSSLIVVAGCSRGVEGERVLGRPGSSAWFNWASHFTIAAHYEKVCDRYGFKKGTDDFANCMMETEGRDRNASAAQSERVSDYLKSKKKTECSTWGTVSSSGDVFSSTTTCD